MKVVAYSVKAQEKEPIAIANHKKHDITLVANELDERSVDFAKGKQAVVIGSTDSVSESIIKKLAAFGVKFIATRSSDYGHIDLKAAKQYGMRLGNVPGQLLAGVAEDQVVEALANETIRNLDCWQSGEPYIDI